MSARLALLPLPTVLFPGLVLPLRIVEERYRALVRQLIALPPQVPREFGVVAIHRGNALLDRPVDAAGRAVTLHSVGCAAVVRTITARPDGRYDLVVVGRRRFEVEGLDTVAAPYLTAEVRWLPEPAGAGAAALVHEVREALLRYLAALDDGSPAEQLPTDPQVVSYLVGATASLTVDDRQLLLAAPDTTARLRTARRMLTREVALLARMRAVPRPLAQWTTHPLPN